MEIAGPLALVTGASSGIGAEFAKGLARKGYGLLLTGREPGRLEETARWVRALGCHAETLALDLGNAGSLEALVAWVDSRPLEVLVNNAGFGLSGGLEEEAPQAIEAMIQVNITTLTLLIRAFLPMMVARGKGRILNLASTAAFQPCPGMAAYGASKAYVLHFSEALAEELAGTGVSVTALCPGPTDSRFAERAGISTSSMFRKMLRPEAVARAGLQALFRRTPAKIVGRSNCLMAFSVRLLPRRLVARVAKRLLRKDSGQG